MIIPVRAASAVMLIRLRPVATNVTAGEVSDTESNGKTLMPLFVKLVATVPAVITADVMFPVVILAVVEPRVVTVPAVAFSVVAVAFVIIAFVMVADVDASDVAVQSEMIAVVMVADVALKEVAVKSENTVAPVNVAVPGNVAAVVNVAVVSTVSVSHEIVCRDIRPPIDVLFRAATAKIAIMPIRKPAKSLLVFFIVLFSRVWIPDSSPLWAVRVYALSRG